jgi:alcohol dehydrogenase class IV
MTLSTFHYANPSTIHWGEGCVRARLAIEIERLGVTRILVVTTGSVAANPGLAPSIERLLEGRVVARFSGIGAHAPAASVMAAVDRAREARADALVSIGGGSPIDAAKAVAFSLATGLDLRDPAALARSRSVEVGRVLPHVAIPTTLSVAELSSGAGFSAEGTRTKVGVAHPALLPAAAFYDATLALETPLPLWLTTGIRAVDHAVETLLAPGDHPLPDVAALEGLSRLRRGLQASKARATDPKARTECQLGAWFSYLLPGPAASGLSHTLGKRLGSRHGIPHGVTSCLLLPHVLRYLAPRHEAAMARIAEVLDAPDAAFGVAELIESLGLPQHLDAWKLTTDDLVEAVRPVASPEHTEAALLAILDAAR